jgi:hypothetical protein
MPAPQSQASTRWLLPRRVRSSSGSLAMFAAMRRASLIAQLDRSKWDRRPVLLNYSPVLIPAIAATNRLAPV